VALPLYLQKQWNVDNTGELCIWMHHSDHLGADVLKARGVAAGVGGGGIFGSFACGGAKDGEPFQAGAYTRSRQSST